MSQITFDYVVYHMRGRSPCPDGIASAWVCHQYNPESELIGMKYGDRLPDLPDNCSLICVDFSFTSAQLEQLKSQNISVLIIDHHVSAFDELTKGLLSGTKKYANSDNGYSYYYDVEECGATLTWKTLFPGKPMPAFLKYVKDRDLWLHELPKSEEMHEAVGQLGRNFGVFDYLAPFSEVKLISTIAPIGDYNVELKRKQIAKICSPKRIIKEIIDNYEVIGILLKPFQSRWSSDICTYLYKEYPEYPFVFTKSIDTESSKYSLRSSKTSGVDVRVIAEKYGGGGHKNAAGFVKHNNV